MASHEALKVLVSGTTAAVQPAAPKPDGKGGGVETLSVDLLTGEIAVSRAPALGGAAEPALAVIGAFRLRAGTVVAIVTGAQKVRARARRGARSGGVLGARSGGRGRPVREPSGRSRAGNRGAPRDAARRRARRWRRCLGSPCSGSPPPS
jgi:hypothetical protein